MNKEIFNFSQKFPNKLDIISLQINEGLGNALKIGLLECEFEYVARVDSDDINRSDRFELQINEFIRNKDLDILGSHIYEFEENIVNIKSKRKVPTKHNEIYRYQKFRDSFNHMTVMFNKNKVLQSGNYVHCPLMEDSLLWSKMLINKAVTSNIDDYLVYARIDSGMHKRRGGYKYFMNYKNARKQILKTGFINSWEYHISIFIQLPLALSPNFLRKIIYKYLLRKKV